MAISTPLGSVPADMRALRIPVSAKPSLLRRIYQAIIQSQQYRADRAIARLLNERGGKFTDALEREIERRYLSPPSDHVIAPEETA